jgi:hypothetical protein
VPALRSAAVSGASRGRCQGNGGGCWGSFLAPTSAPTPSGLRAAPSVESEFSLETASRFCQSTGGRSGGRRAPVALQNITRRLTGYYRPALGYPSRGENRSVDALGDSWDVYWEGKNHGYSRRDHWSDSAGARLRRARLLSQGRRRLKGSLRRPFVLFAAGLTREPVSPPLPKPYQRLQKINSIVTIRT